MITGGHDFKVINNNENIRTPLKVKLVKENNEWKISYFHEIGINLIVSQDN